MAAIERGFLRDAGLNWGECRHCRRAETYNWRELRRELIPLLRGAQNLLELGAGEGRLTAWLLQHLLRPGQSLTALDLRTEALEALARRHAGLRVAAGDLRALPAELQDFDAAICRLTLHELACVEEEMPRVLTGVADRLKSEGRLVIIDKVLDGTAGVTAEIVAENLRAELAALRGETLYGLHRLADYVALVEAAGLKPLRAAIIGQDPGPRYNLVQAAKLRQSRDLLLSQCPAAARPEAERLIERALAEMERADAAYRLPHALIEAKRPAPKIAKSHRSFSPPRTPRTPRVER